MPRKINHTTRDEMPRADETIAARGRRSRAHRLRAALVNHMRYEDDPRIILIDLLTDARHFAETYEVHFATANDTARAHFIAERGNR